MKSGFYYFCKNIKQDLLNDIVSLKHNPKGVIILVLFIIIYLGLIIFIPILALLYLLFIILATFISFTFYFRDYFLSDYRKKTHVSLFDANLNISVVVEYETWKILNSQSIYKKIVINSYIPKPNGETAEIDMIMICEFGIYVFECKSNGGWIFGNENHHKWINMYNRNRKYRFYNPVTQNKNHITYLNNLLQLDYNLYKSFIVFGNNCVLKKITTFSKDVDVINREKLDNILKYYYSTSPKLLSKDNIDIIYNTLKVYMNPSKKIKKQHNDDTRKYSI